MTPATYPQNLKALGDPDISVGLRPQSEHSNCCGATTEDHPKRQTSVYRDMIKPVIDCERQVGTDEIVPAAISSDQPVERRWPAVSASSYRLGNYLFSADVNSPCIAVVCTEEPRPAWLVETVRSLRALATVPHNWDGEGSPPPSHDIIKAAIRLLSQVPCSLNDELPIPFVCPVAEGELQVEWTSQARHVELEFLDAHTIVFLTEDPEQKQEAICTGEYHVENVAKTIELLKWFLAR